VVDGLARLFEMAEAERLGHDVEHSFADGPIVPARHHQRDGDVRDAGVVEPERVRQRPRDA
jgi:hypothetical protein